MVNPNTQTSNLKNNPINQDMQEAAGKMGADFNTNVVTNEHYEIIEIVVGELRKSYLRGVEVCKKTCLCYIKQKAEVVIVILSVILKISTYIKHKRLFRILIRQ